MPLTVRNLNLNVSPLNTLQFLSNCKSEGDTKDTRLFKYRFLGPQKSIIRPLWINKMLYTLLTLCSWRACILISLLFCKILRAVNASKRVMWIKSHWIFDLLELLLKEKAKATTKCFLFVPTPNSFKRQAFSFFSLTRRTQLRYLNKD